MTKRTVVLTGGSSSLGKYVLEGLSDEFKFISVGRRNSDIYLDLGDEQSIDQIGVRCDVALLIAADFGGASLTQASQSLRANISGNLLLCEKLIDQGCSHIIFISSTSAAHEVSHPYYNWYSIFKRFAEESIRHLCTLRNVSLTILRPTQIYDGARSFKKHQPLFYAIVDAALKNQDFVFVGDASFPRNYVYVNDVVEAIRRSIIYEFDGVFEIRGPQTLNIIEIAQIIYSAFGSSGNFSVDKQIEESKQSAVVVASQIELVPEMNSCSDLFYGVQQILKYEKC